MNCKLINVVSAGVKVGAAGVVLWRKHCAGGLKE